MALNDIFLALKKYSNMDLQPPCGHNTVLEFEKNNRIELPVEYKELLALFNGGEIFIPGTTIFGLNDLSYSIKKENRHDLRALFSIPNTYLIIGKLNFGDFICINLNAPFDVIQWDHENDLEYCNWSSITEWLNDEIENYKANEEGEP